MLTVTNEEEKDIRIKIRMTTRVRILKSVTQDEDADEDVDKDNDKDVEEEDEESDDGVVRIALTQSDCYYTFTCSVAAFCAVAFTYSVD